MERLRTILPFAGVGVLATLTGMAAGHLVAALTTPSASPVLAVGSTVIDLTPTPVKEWAVREFGTADKPILIGSVVLITLVLAGVAGVLARRRFVLGAGLLVLLVALAGLAAVLRPMAGPLDALPSVLAAVIGLGALWWLVSGLIGTGAPEAAPGATTAATTKSTATGAGAGATSTATSGSGGTETLTTDGGASRKPEALAHPGGSQDGILVPRDHRPSRRTLLIGTGALSVAAVAMGFGGERIISYRTKPGNVTLPAPADSKPALPAGLEEKYPGISKFTTPNSEFYRVDTNLTLPVVPVNGWTLTIDGDVEQELTFTFDDLAAMDLVERDITLTCVSNEVGGRYVGAARWLGVPLKDLLDKAGVGSKADQILSTATDGFTISTPLEVAMDGRDTMIAIGMNGEALPAAHGFPARLITPGIYGYVGATKWLTKLTLTTYEEQEAYWTERDWATDAPIKISSRIDTPAPLSNIDAGKAVIGGVAWAQTRGIRKVEVRVDGGPWQEAKLGPDAGVDYWRQWFLPWDAAKGSHMLAVRATDMDGKVQTDVRASPFPEGSSGVQEIVVNVT
ncbi:molybdopterin-dependent oxidoreductase [Nocardioides donggukensis]|uniref:Molybdopterin-dependent oxidoreductase n=1 Tax=Nocardioides donggukensis TaxID=2774019 RepID=A0A927K8Z5_9ACTN|nr:molybdopterin-dependent oxidoreductase [Nocardioides donggukensis]MBD8871178.1 molybdopterin-dependent oxidoreductase [Nocardioides donggukensis]